MRKHAIKAAKLNSAQRDTIRRIHGALANIDGVTLNQRLEAIQRGLIGEREIDIWNTLTEIRENNSGLEFSESKQMALAMMLLMFMGGKTFEIRRHFSTAPRGKTNHSSR